MRLRVALALALTVSAAACGQTGADKPPAAAAVTAATAPAQPQAEPPPFGFSGMEMYKMAWDTAVVAFGDVNGDGLTDIVAPENSKGRIQCLIQRRGPGKPASPRTGLNPNELPDDARYEKRPYLAGKRVFNLALGDLNGDGRADLAYYGDPPELVVVYQNAKGEWGEKKTFDIQDGAQHPHTLIAEDFNGDKRVDLCLLGKDSTYFIYQTDKGELAPPVKQPGVPEGVFALVAGDFDGDGREDLLYAVGGDEEPYYIRLQDTRGRMSANVPLETTKIRAMIAGALDADPAHEILSIEQATGRLVVHKLAREKKDGLLKGQPRVYPLASAGAGKPRSMALADLDGDGRLDVLVTDPRAAKIEWYRQDEDGALLLPQEFPALQNASTVLMADLDGDKQPEVLVLSPDEQTLGLARRLPTGRISFPERLPTEDKPTAAGVGDLDGDGIPEIIYASVKGFERHLTILKRQGAEFAAAARYLIEKTKSDAEDIVVADANQDGRPDILVFEPFTGIRVFAQDQAGKFADASLNPRYGAGLVKDAKRSGFALGDVTGDGKPEMLIADKNFARALRLDASGALQIVDQFNGRSPESRIEGVGVADLDGDKVNEVLLLDTQGKVVSVLKRQEAGAYRIVQNLQVGPLRLRGMEVVDFDRDGVPDVLAFGLNKMVIVASRSPHLVLREIAAYETGTERGVLADVALGDLNGDGKPDVILNETTDRAMEILTYDADARKFAVRMKFRVFEKKTFPGRGPQAEEAGRVEPRAMETADVSGDGKTDLILLIHDRIMVYPQD